MGKKKERKKAERKLEKLKGRLRAEQAFFLDLHASNRKGFALLGDIADSFIKLVLASARGDLKDVKTRESRLILELRALEGIVGEVYETGKHLWREQHHEDRSNGSPQEASAN